jgi:hypothetical protein
MATPEDRAREQIDQALEQACWKVQDYKSAHLQAGRGVVLRNFPLVSGHGFADYLRYIDGKAAGVIETKKEGFPLAGVEAQAVKYSAGLPRTLPIYLSPLPFLIEKTQIVPEMERRLPVIEELEAPIEVTLTRADRLRQAILHSAFSGRFAEPPQNGHG